MSSTPAARSGPCAAGAGECRPRPHGAPLAGLVATWPRRCLRQAEVTVYDEDADGRRVANPTETAAAQEKAGLLAQRFSEWCWEDPARASALAGAYNERFNSLVLRSYDGASPSLPGLALSFEPRDHQLAAVARIVAEPSTLLAHEVGAGKTAEMVIAAMELRRLGLATKVYGRGPEPYDRPVPA